MCFFLFLCVCTLVRLFVCVCVFLLFVCVGSFNISFASLFVRSFVRACGCVLLFLCVCMSLVVCVC